jgi:hypothetical protein
MGFRYFNKKQLISSKKEKRYPFMESKKCSIDKKRGRRNKDIPK